jgi:hypothetical protein
MKIHIPDISEESAFTFENTSVVDLERIGIL